MILACIHYKAPRTKFKNQPSYFEYFGLYGHTLGLGRIKIISDTGNRVWTYRAIIARYHMIREVIIKPYSERNNWNVKHVFCDTIVTGSIFDSTVDQALWAWSCYSRFYNSTQSMILKMYIQGFLLIFNQLKIVVELKLPVSPEVDINSLILNGTCYLLFHFCIWVSNLRGILLIYHIIIRDSFRDI